VTAADNQGWTILRRRQAAKSAVSPRASRQVETV